MPLECATLRKKVERCAIYIKIATSNESGEVDERDHFPEVLPYWYFVCACAVSLDLKFLPYAFPHRSKLMPDHNYCEVLQHVGNVFSLLIRACLRCLLFLRF